MDIQEDELIFKRFPEDKQEQVRGLVNYATLMGLTGKDLVSIGGKLDRLKSALERKANMDIVRSFECLPIGKDRGRGGKSLDSRFKLKTTTGAYNFVCRYSHEWEVTSLATKKVVNYSSGGHEKYELGNTLYWGLRNRYTLLLDIAKGRLVLNF